MGLSRIFNTGFKWSNVLRSYSSFPSSENTATLLSSIKEFQDRTPIIVTVEEKIESLERTIGYHYENPEFARRALWGITDHGRRRPPGPKMAHYCSLQLLGRMILKIITEIQLSPNPPIPLLATQGSNDSTISFPPNIANQIVKSVLSNPNLARVSVRMGLWERKVSDTFVGDAAFVFERADRVKKAMMKGDFNFEPIEYLGHFVEAVAGSIFADCRSAEICYHLLIQNIRLHENPVFLLFNEYKGNKYPTLKQNGSETIYMGWTVMLDSEKLGHGITMIAAANAAYLRTLEKKADGTLNR